MGLTYRWQDSIDVAAKLSKNIPVSSIDARICDMVNGVIWKKYPWQRSRTNIAAGLIPLADDDQDFSAPPNIYRLLKCRIVRTDTTPDEIQELDVQNDLDPDLVKRSYRDIRVASLQADIGQIRLESAVSVPTGTTLEIQGEYQLNPIKVTSLAQDLWFDDTFLEVPVEGLMYWRYKLSDDARAGNLQIVDGGRTVYTGQLGIFHSAIDQMWKAEEYGNVEQFFPDTPLGVGRSSGGTGIFG